MKQLLIIASVFVASGAVAQPAAADTSDAERAALFEQARDDRVNGDYASCYEKMKRAVAIDRTPGVTSLLGDCAVAAGKPAEGAYYLSLALKMELPQVVADNTRKQLAAAKKKIAVVMVHLQPPAAALSINGAPAEPVDGAVFVMPGQHTFRGEHEDHAPAEQTADFKAGESRTIALSLKANRVVPVPNPPDLEKESGGVPLAVPIVIGVVGLAGIGVGVAGEVLRGAAEEDYAAARTRLGEGERLCRQPSPASASDCTAVDGAIADHNRYRAIEIAGFVVGGAALATAAILLPFADFGGDEPDGETAISIAPAVAPGAYGIGIRGTW